MQSVISYPASVDDKDIFMCGRCKLEFYDFALFRSHKQKCSPSNLQNYPTLESDIQGYGTEQFSDPLLGLAKAATFINGEESVLCFKEEDAADVLISGFSNPKQAVFEVTVTPSVDEDPDHNADVYDSSELKIVQQEETIAEETYSSVPEENSDCNEKSKSAKIRIKPKKPGERAYRCGSCNKTFIYHKDLTRHSRIHTGEKPYSCDVCSKGFNRADKLQVHSMIHKGIKPYACGTCDYTCFTSSLLKVHQMIHTDARPWKCQICSYSARNSSQLTVHLRRHTGDLPFSCSFPNCKSMFKTGSNLRRHQKVHVAKTLYTCYFCSRECNSKLNLKTHIKALHLRKAKLKKSALHKEDDNFLGEHITILNKTATKEFTKRKSSCQLCSHDCSLKDQHEYRNKPKTSRLKEKNNGTMVLERKFSCCTCKQSFVREDSLRSHEKIHPKDSVADEFLTVSQIQGEDVMIYYVPVKSANDCTASTLLEEYPETDFILVNDAETDDVEV